MEVLIVVGRVSAGEIIRELPEEELEDVAKFVLIVGRVRRVESEEVCEAARGVRLDAAVLVEEDGGVDEGGVVEALAKCSGGCAVESEGVKRRDTRVEPLRPKPRPTVVAMELRYVGP